MVYVGNYNGGTVSVINGATNAVVTTITTGSYPDGIVVNPATNTVYVTNQGSNTVSVINGATNTVTTTISGLPGNPSLITFNPNTNMLYTADYTSSNTVSVINAATNTLVTNITG